MWMLESLPASAALRGRIEFAAGVQVESIVKGGAQTVWMFGPLIDFSESQLVGIVLLANVFWFLIAAALAVALRRLPNQRRAAMGLLTTGSVGLILMAENVTEWGECVKDVWITIGILAGATDYFGGAALVFARLLVPGAVIDLPFLSVVALAFATSATGLSAVRLTARYGPVLGLAVLAVYGLELIPTLRQAAHANYVLEQSLTHE